MLLWLALACSDKVAPQDSASPALPALVLDAETLDFGALALDGRSVSDHTVLAQNVGEAELLLSEISLERGADSPFTLTLPSDRSLSPGESAAIELRFQALWADEALDTLRVLSNDPANPQATVSLRGTGEGPALALDPADAVDMGATLLGCSRAQDLTLRNAGNDTLRVSAAQLSGDAAFLLDLLPSQNGALPWDLEPGETLQVRVTYTPSEAAAQSATVRVNSDDALHPAVELVVNARGEGVGEREDRFTADARIDLLFAVDTNSVSQAPLGQLQDDITLLADHLRREGVDGQIAAVVADDGCVLGDTVAFTPSLSATEQRQVFVTMTSGSPGALAQQPFALANAALDGASGCNQGLFRADAVVALVGFSARDDQSGQSARASVQDLQERMTRPSRLVFSAIAGPTPSGCGSATSATTMDQAVTLTDGVFGSICASNYRTTLEDIADAAAERALGSYPLSAPPVVTSLHVELRGVERTSGWRYDEDERAIFFDASARPALGDSVLVRYEASAETCE